MRSLFAQTTLCARIGKDLFHIGTTRRDIGHLGSQRRITNSHRSIGWRARATLTVLLLCTACVLESTHDANAQCTASDVLRGRLTFSTAPVVEKSQNPVTSASKTAVWKTITVGTFADPSALVDALNAIGCGGGDVAAILARTGFTVSGTKMEVELVTVSASELGFLGETASLQQIYKRAQHLGLGLASAEIALQLRLQYSDQPIGEFLIIGMEPIRTWADEFVIPTVANGGAGLILIGHYVGADAEIPVTSRLVFVRSLPVAPAAMVQD